MITVVPFFNDYCSTVLIVIALSEKPDKDAKYTLHYPIYEVFTKCFSFTKHLIPWDRGSMTNPMSENRQTQRNCTTLFPGSTANLKS
jgi:hypothetical protein